MMHMLPSFCKLLLIMIVSMLLAKKRGKYMHMNWIMKRKTHMMLHMKWTLLTSTQQLIPYKPLHPNLHLNMMQMTYAQGQMVWIRPED
jgi:hypothetical protein